MWDLLWKCSINEKDGVYSTDYSDLKKKITLLITSVRSATNIKTSECAFESCLISIITKKPTEPFFHCI